MRLRRVRPFVLKLICTRTHRKPVILTFVAVFSIIASINYFCVVHHDQYPYTLTSQEHRLEEWKKIRNSSSPQLLFWTPYFGKYDLNFIGIQSNTFDNCPVYKCLHVTFDKNQLHKSDAVLFHIRDIDSVPLPPVHDPNQIWIFLLQESPTHTGTDLSKSKYSSIFNWTMTYRHDSDVYYPYSKVEPLKVPMSGQSKYLTPVKVNQLTSKPKLIAWIVSHCTTHSNRESFVKELQKYVDVDIYGACGSHQCPSDNVHECYEYIATKYKFYLSFENSLCSDYVTEKYFDALQVDIVPVVYGWNNYSRISPPNSFIDVRQQFNNSAAKVAKYLLHLNRNDVGYLKYFKWKDSYEVIPSSGSSWCELCKKLMLRDVTGSKKHYQNIGQWWNSVPTKDDALKKSMLNYRLNTESLSVAEPACLDRPVYTWFDRIVQIFL